MPKLPVTPGLKTLPGQNGHDKWSRPSLSGSKGTLTWAEAPTAALQDAIAAVTEDGAAVLLSKTSDGGALLIQILSDKSKPKLYAASYEELHDVLVLVKEIALNN